MNADTIAAGIVLYNPDDYSRFLKCLESVLKQVNKIYVFDNSDSLDIPDDIKNKIEYISENRNLGIAYALNRIMEKAKSDGYKWVITMDQDSILPENLIKEYAKVISSNNMVGIVCPQVIDSRRAYMKVIKEPKIEYVEECITSASCTSIKAWEFVGKFDEYLFIDLVDNEFCKRLICSGFSIVRINDYVLDQEFGKIIPKSKKVQDFWIKVGVILRNENFAKFSYKKFVSPMRVYYSTRNIIYVNKKLKLYGPTAFQNYNCKGFCGFLICFCLPSFLRAQNKIQVLSAIIRGLYDGLKTKVKPWQCSKPYKEE